ncbi:helix-turn-helix transcriptional regulator [Paenibacillus sp. GM2]|uniref:helix-turn-helix transcriptional regulator n=1 Tax=Paenibacillus sp. GM2 TaxID=1622070 RepID=UPI0009ECD558|nr:AraC family transcriptional regulator [Paenibacillus sp. GM2]
MYVFFFPHLAEIRGMDSEYAKSLADQYIRQVENARSSAELTRLIREMYLTFTSSIKELSNKDYSVLVKNAIRYMHTHFFEKLTLQEIADKIGKHPSYVSDHIHKETGMSFIEHLNQIRIKESRRLLTHTPKSVYDIAIAVGFEYQNYFAKVFKKTVGVTPLQYRNGQREPHKAPNPVKPISMQKGSGPQ